MADLSNTFMNVRPHWVLDDEATSCKRCGVEFTLFNRRHHCRNCGQVFCSVCAQNEIKIPKLSYKQPVRVCHECYNLLSRHNF